MIDAVWLIDGDDSAIFNAETGLRPGGKTIRLMEMGPCGRVCLLRTLVGTVRTVGSGQAGLESLVPPYSGGHFHLDE